MTLLEEHKILNSLNMIYDLTTSYPSLRRHKDMVIAVIIKLLRSDGTSTN